MKEVDTLQRSIEFFERIIAETQHPVYFHAHLARLKDRMKHLLS